MNKEQLIKFESEIASLFLDKKILFPVHLSKGNEDDLIEIFKEIKPEDWVFSTHRNHYHALLYGFEDLKEWIQTHGSMHVYGERFFTSGIVGGCLPVALGVAMGIKRKGSEEKVWCFVGDMAAETGMFHECLHYAVGHELPINFIIEDNGYSVDTPTDEVWGRMYNGLNYRRYVYERGYPHQGTGEFVIF